MQRILVGTLVLSPAYAQAAENALRGIGFDERLSGEATLADAIRAVGSSANGLSLNVRIIVERSAVETQPGTYSFDALDARLASYRGLDGVQVYLDLRGPVTAPDTLADWGRFVRALSTRYRGVVRGYVFGVQPADAARPTPKEHAFFVKTTSVNLRAGDEATAPIMGGVRDTDADWLATLYQEDIGPYLDAVGLDAATPNAAILALIDQHDPSSSVVLLGESLGDDPAVAPRRFVDRHLGLLGSRVSGVTYAARVPVVAAVLAPIVSLRRLLEQQLVTLDEKTLSFRLNRGGQDVTDKVSHRLLFGVGTLTNYLIYTEPNGPLELVISDPNGTRPLIADGLRDSRTPVRSFTYDPVTRLARMELPAEPRTLVADWNTGNTSGYTTLEQVSSTVLPSVAEIISRHQRAQTVQEALLRSYVARATMDQHFRTTAVDSGFDVITENRLFVEGQQSEWEELSFSLNGTKWGPKRPAFPLIQAEKVLSLPLDLRLDADYRYQFVGVEDVDGRACFALRFDPVDEQRSLYRGTVWIDRETYVKLKAQTVQTQLASPVLSSEEIHFFTAAGKISEQPIYLLTRLVGRQIMLIAGRNLLVERGVVFDRFQLNPADFEAQRAAARDSDHVMYRDTDEGLRYLGKKDGARVVLEATTTARAALLGVTYDPSYDFPLPLAGINYIDFNFLGKDSQLAVVFGGVLALVNIQKTKLLGPRVDGSLDLFAIAIKANDRTYDGSGELAGQRLNTLPFSTGINLGWQIAQFQKLVASYQFRFDSITTDTDSAPTFRAPVSTITNGFGLTFEWKQAGYSFLAGGTSYHRAEWEQWGEPGDYRPDDQKYLKYSAGLTKDFFFGFHKIHLNAAYYGGRRLDRFSAYQFGFFDENRVHGVPSAGVRFGELAMFRGSYALNLFEQYRLELFVDQAYGRDPRLSNGWQAVTGIGIGGNTRGPFDTMLRLDAGKSFLPTQYRKPGSLVVQLQILKPL